MSALHFGRIIDAVIAAPHLARDGKLSIIAAPHLDFYDLLSASSNPDSASTRPGDDPWLVSFNEFSQITTTNAGSASAKTPSQDVTTSSDSSKSGRKVDRQVQPSSKAKLDTADLDRQIAELERQLKALTHGSPTPRHTTSAPGSRTLAEAKKQPSAQALGRNDLNGEAADQHGDTAAQPSSSRRKKERERQKMRRRRQRQAKSNRLNEAAEPGKDGADRADNPPKSQPYAEAPPAEQTSQSASPAASTASSSGFLSFTKELWKQLTSSTSVPTTLERLQESQSRPAWGTRPDKGKSGSESKKGLSYKALRSADKVSPIVPVSTAHNSTPYQIESTTRKAFGKDVSSDQSDSTSSAPPVDGKDASEAVQDDANKATKPRKSTRPATKDQSTKRKSKTLRERRSEALKGRRSAERSTIRRVVSRKDNTSEVEDTVDKSQTMAAKAVQKLAETSPKAAEKKVADVDVSKQHEPVFEEIDEIEDDASTVATVTMKPGQMVVTPLEIDQGPVPYLAYGLDRVLFNPGVYQLQDPASRVYNFDPYLQHIVPINEFDFDALKPYKQSSEDDVLGKLARQHDRKYIGSTSSMTSTLANFHFLLSNWRPINLSMLSSQFMGKTTSNNFTQITRCPSSIFLRWQNGTYAIDADKEYDTPNVLMLLGKSMELLLTLPRHEYEPYRKDDPRTVSEEQRTAPETYHYSTMGDFLMRSQLDAYDPRLPGNGTFDLKTRAVVSVRHRVSDYKPMMGYEISSLRGKFGSYEKEYFDMIRATMLKYMLQARIGAMNGIFVAYHNIERIFGFQYVSMSDMDLALHGQEDTCLGDQEFRASVHLLNDLLNRATAMFPEQSLRIQVETLPEGTRDGQKVPTQLHFFAEPMEEFEIEQIQSSQKERIDEWTRLNMGVEQPSKPDEDVFSENFSAATNNVDTSAAVTEPLVDIVEAQTADESTKTNSLTVSEGQENTEVDEVAVASSTGSLGTDATTEVTAEATTQASAESIAETTVEPTAEADAETSLEASAEAATEAIAEPASHETHKTSNTAPTSTPDSSHPLKPLFYATVLTSSTINGHPSPDNRPTNLRPHETWTIDTLIREHPVSATTWARYSDLRARRRAALWGKGDAEDGVSEEGGAPAPGQAVNGKEGKEAAKKPDRYIQFLQILSEEGRETRRKLDAIDRGREKVRVDGPGGLREVRERVEGIDDYLGLLYAGKGRGRVE